MKYLVIWLILTGVITSPGTMDEKQYAPSIGIGGVYIKDGTTMDYRNFKFLDTEEEANDFIREHRKRMGDKEVKYFCLRVETDSDIEPEINRTLNIDGLKRSQTDDVIIMWAQENFKSIRTRLKKLELDAKRIKY